MARPCILPLLVLSAALLRCELPARHRPGPPLAGPQGSGTGSITPHHWRVYAPLVAGPGRIPAAAACACLSEAGLRRPARLGLRGGGDEAMSRHDGDSGPHVQPNKRPRSAGPGESPAERPDVTEVPDARFVAAVTDGDSAALRRLVVRGANVNRCADNSTSELPIHLAASRGLTSCVATLLELGANVDARDRFGNAPIHDAALNGQTATLARLVEGGANIEAANLHGLRPLHCAAANGHAATIKALLALGADVAAKSVSGATPLRWAALRGHLPAVRLILASSRRADQPTGGSGSSEASGAAARQSSPAAPRALAAADASNVTLVRAVEAAIAREESRGGDALRLKAVAAFLLEVGRPAGALAAGAAGGEVAGAAEDGGAAVPSDMARGDIVARSHIDSSGASAAEARPHSSMGLSAAKSRGVGDGGAREMPGGGEAGRWRGVQQVAGLGSASVEFVRAAAEAREEGAEVEGEGEGEGGEDGDDQAGATPFAFELGLGLGGVSSEKDRYGRNT